MIHYIISFTVYTLAMSGLIALALFVYKKVMTGNLSGKNSKLLSIEETMAINPRKTLMIVKAGEERFLIASDVDKTSLIAKLESNGNITADVQNQTIEIPQKEKKFIDLNKVKESIETKNIDVLFPTKNKKNNPKRNEDSTNNKKIVHFETINCKNPQQIRNHKRKVSIDVGKVKNHGLSTIKEIAHKVNEL